MKTNTFLSIILASIFLFACKKASKSEEVTSDAVVKKENFSVEVNIITDKNDDFPLYYTEDGTINFNGDQASWSGVKGQEGPQDVIIDLSEEIIPTHIRLDFGIKKGLEQGDVTLNKFKMSYYGKSFEIKGSEFLNYFIKNDSVDTVIDQVKGTILIKKNPKSNLNRFYYPRQELQDEIAKMTK